MIIEQRNRPQNPSSPPVMHATPQNTYRGNKASSSHFSKLNGVPTAMTNRIDENVMNGARMYVSKVVIRWEKETTSLRTFGGMRDRKEEMWGKSSGRRADVCDICMLISAAVRSRGAVTWVIILHFCLP